MLPFKPRTAAVPRGCRQSFAAVPAGSSPYAGKDAPHGVSALSLRELQAAASLALPYGCGGPVLAGWLWSLFSWATLRESFGPKHWSPADVLR